MWYSESATTCDAGILFDHWFKALLFNFQSSSLLLQQQLKTLELGPLSATGRPRRSSWFLALPLPSLVGVAICRVNHQTENP